MQLIVLSGLPGSGKSTLAEGLSRTLSMPVFSVDPIEAAREAWRNLAAKYQAGLKIIECVCADETVHRRRIEARVRKIDGMPEVTWARVQERRAEYEDWTDVRLILDTSVKSAAQLLDDALNYLASS